MSEERPVLYFDVGSPWAWVAGEIAGGLPVWEPVLGAWLPGGAAFDGVDREAVAAAASEHGLLAPRFPERFPFDSELAMLAAAFARRTGRTVAFSLAAMRQAFTAGRDLSVEDNVLIAAAACELHPRAMLAALGIRAVGSALQEATDAAARRGVGELPALAVGDELVTGPAAVDRAAELQPTG